VTNSEAGGLRGPLPSGRSAVSYAFGDTDIARERLGIVADTFASPTRALLRDLPPGGRRYVVDLGCGPGYTTALLCDAFPHGFVTGLDASDAMVAEARERFPEAMFAVADVTTPLRLPAHLVYARLLLGHLPDPENALAHWSTALLTGGLLVCEEPVRYRSDHPVFARYEEAVTAAVAARGANLWAGPALDNDPPQCARFIDRVVEYPVPAARAAAMFWRNAATWGGDAELVDALRRIERDGDEGTVLWELRQTGWVKDA
jgi:trans-aconitate 2-methyltransferase